MDDNSKNLTCRRLLNRRSFLGMSGMAMGLGMAGCAATGAGHRGLMSGSSKTQKIDGKSTVSLIANSDRRQATYDALKPLRSDVVSSIGKRHVVIKVNAGFPTEDHRIHSTYPGQVRGILDFLR